ncbi:MAG: RecX family transcriptional regulator [Sphingomonadales bacterium]
MTDHDPSCRTPPRTHTRPQKRRRRITSARLRNWALGYLGRFAATEAHLVVVLDRKIKRYLDETADATEQERWRTEARAVACDMVRMGVVDDRLYAEGRARSLHRRGRSGALIVRELTARGVAQDLAGQVVADLAADEGGNRTALDLKAAAALARRRRIGPYRSAEAVPDDRVRRRELGILARAGFGFVLARTVIEAVDEAALFDAFDLDGENLSGQEDLE